MPDSKSTELTDFPDKFSPMLVKELRQGLRTNLFVSAFILLQGFMILCILMGSAETNSTNTASNGFFWFFIIVALVVVQPLRGFSALSGEFNLNTMDLIQMTRLDAWRITWGKWLAVNAQTLLLVAAIAPYLVLRYFFGSINIFSDLGLLVLCTVASALLSAITVGCSAFKNLIVRLALLIGAGVLFTRLWAFTTQELLRGSISRSEILILALIVYSAIFGTFFFLAFGATRIAPASENLSTAKRLIGLAFAIGAWAFQLFGADAEGANVIASIILALVMIDAITEDTPVFESVLKPFQSPPKRILAWLLSPGWHTGILFFAVVAAFLFFPMVFHYFKFKPDADEIGVAVYGAGMLIFPLLIIHIFFKKSSVSHFALYLFIQACLGLLTILAVAVAENSSVNDELVYLAAGIPPVLFFGNLESNLSTPFFLILGIIWLALSLLIPLIRARSFYGIMKKILKSPTSTDS
ncbi:MAG: hypothetical protein P1V20_20705 [Verrucomicrobiales bacterium]|nr:hypothetical protein [Verrucomicrobiales bacterium]